MDTVDREFFNYCEHCGRRFDIDELVCPGCARRWQPSFLPANRETTKAMLEMLQEWRRANLLPAETYAALRERAEQRFKVVEPGGMDAFQPREPDIDYAARERAALPRRGTPAGPGFGALIAERQADILLYLGAFLLGIAALIFVAYQEDAVSAAVRVPVLAGYTLAGIIGGTLVRRWERVREAGHVFLALGALLVPLNFVLLYTDVLRDQEVPGDLVWMLASVFCMAFYGALAWRGLGSFYRVPAGLALLSGWTSLISLLSIAPEWAGAWYMLLAVAVAAAAAPRWPSVVTSAAVLGGIALFWAYAAIPGEHHWQLATANGLAAGGVAGSCYRLRIGSGLFVVLLLGAATVAAALWPLGAPAPTFAYPFLAGGVLSLVTRKLAAGWPRFAETGAWWFAAAMTIAPLAMLNTNQHTGWSGLGFMGSAAILAFLAWKNTECGITATGMKVEGQPPRTNWWERAAYGWAAAGFAMAGAALWQEQIGITEPHTGLLFAGFAMVPALAVAFVPQFRSDEALGMAIPASAVASFVALPGEGHPLYAAAFLALPGVAWFAACAPSQRWTPAVVGTAFLALASLGVWAEYEWPYWALALAFAGAGLAGFAILTPWRAYPAVDEGPVCAVMLSWGLHAAALLVVGARLAAFQSDRLETGRGLLALVIERGDYRVLIVLVSMLAPLVAFEGLRVGLRLILLPASAIAVAAVLLTIGLANPANVQFYTAPIGVYLLTVGLVLRRSPAFIPPHLQWHEAALVAGVAFIVLPQAEQSFDPDGAVWGLVLIAEGLAFLGTGFVLRARWLVPSGTLVLSAVAIRWLFESGGTVPYWLTLGVLGTLLLGGGLLVLLKAEWWTRTRARASRWWQQTGTDGTDAGSPPQVPRASGADHQPQAH